MDLSPSKQQMQKVMDYFQTELKSIQVWRASAGMLDNINVQAEYGTMKIPQMWHISTLDSKTLKVESRDKKQLGAITKAIYDADLWLAPQNEWEYILVKVPSLTEERREEISKKVKFMWEEAKAQIRNARQDVKNESKKLFTDKDISEDEHKNNEIDIDNLTKDKNNEIDTLVKEKIEDIMKI